MTKLDLMWQLKNAPDSSLILIKDDLGRYRSGVEIGPVSKVRLGRKFVDSCGSDTEHFYVIF